jgi:uncharacterized protein (DUF362 family)/Pyruvate/2-oxoacid:ferredoxin oxidoreductase delta subunit
MATVIIRNATYDYDTLRPLFFGLMNAIDDGLIKGGVRVLIKPNLLSAALPHQAIVTHPLIVKAAVEYVLEKGARPTVSDSPAIGSFEKIIRESGIKDALFGHNVACRAFEKSLKIDIGEPFNVIDIAADAVSTDVIINLPKLKTHSQMLLTLGVKNLFGCIEGYRKPEWHLRTGVNRVMFAKLLVLIYQKIKPSYTILDGILAMEGEGPGSSGIPKALGLLIGSRDAFAMDSTVCRILGVEPQSLLTLRVAGEMGLVEPRIVIDGDMPIIRDFRFPEVGPLVQGPEKLRRFMRRYLIRRPVVDERICTLCSVCRNFCPVGAISLRAEKLHFDYNRCIRCYCCLEVCPHGALRTLESFPGRITRKVIEKHS